MYHCILDYCTHEGKGSSSRIDCFVHTYILRNEFFGVWKRSRWLPKEYTRKIWSLKTLSCLVVFVFFIFSIDLLMFEVQNAERFCSLTALFESKRLILGKVEHLHVFLMQNLWLNGSKKHFYSKVEKKNDDFFLIKVVAWLCYLPVLLWKIPRDNNDLFVVLPDGTKAQRRNNGKMKL